MAISSIPSYGSSAPARSQAASCPTCGNGKTSTAQTFSKGYTGRDSYVCASCGQSKPASSSYCPTCTGGSSAKSNSSSARPTSFPSTAGNSTYNCPTCGKNSAASVAANKAPIAANNSKNQLSWVR